MCCLRGGVLGLVAMLVTYVGHVLAGGDPVAVRELVVPVVVSAGLCLMLSRRRLSFLALLTALGGSQVLFHLWFLRADLLTTGAHSSTSSMTMGQMHGGLGLMIAAHAAAAVVSALLLLVCEDGLWDLLALLASRLWVAVSTVVATPRRPCLQRVAATTAVPSWTSWLVGSVQPRRGPPAAAAV